jgi:hypothetical protein
VIPADSGGGGSFTVWEAYDIETLHNMVQGVSDAEIETSWQQVSAWSKTHELLDEHAAKLAMYRQDLVAKWPPEKNQAAAAFVSYLDTLTLALQQGSTAAANNVTALANLTGAVSTAKTEVQKAYQEYKTNQGKLDAYQQKVDTYTATSSQSDAPAPTPSPGPSPIAPNRQNELTKQARQSMAVLSGAAVDSTMKMQVPPPYQPPRATDLHKSEHIGDGPPAAVMSPPVIPAPRTSGSASVPSAPSVPGGTGGGGAGAGIGPIGSGGGPTLSGGVLAPPPPPPVVPPAPPTVGPLPGPGLGGGGPLPPGRIIGPGIGPGGSGPTSGGPGIKPAKVTGLGKYGPGSLPIEAREGNTAGRALPPGGVIGAPGAGGSPGGRGAGGARPTATGRRINPVGGVLGQGGPSGGSAGRAGGGRTSTGGASAGQPMLASQRRGKGDRDHDSRTWDPDDPWAVEHGVAPVLEPGQEPSSHDPGPGVIGIDR